MSWLRSPTETALTAMAILVRPRLIPRAIQVAAASEMTVAAAAMITKRLNV
ncbi:hypothetical protein D3C87_2149970 [compost metagenome]